MNAVAFAAALETAGFQCAVETDGKLAILIHSGDVEPDARQRRSIVSMGRAHGFTNVCIEIRPTNAALSGD